jgi:hypothetical protein
VNVLENGIVLLNLVLLHELIDFSDRISELVSKVFINSDDIGGRSSGVDTLTILGAGSVEDYHDNL